MQTINLTKATPYVISSNANRARWTLTFTPSSIAAGNTGKIFVGRGFVPNAVVGDSNQGDVLNAGSQIEEKAQYKGDPTVWQGMITIATDTDNQEITIDEQSFD